MLIRHKSRKTDLFKIIILICTHGFKKARPRKLLGLELKQLNFSSDCF